jgi:hypothetical protein
MFDPLINPVGPMCGPNFVVCVVKDQDHQYTVQVYPDANNALLKANGLPTQYYWQPSSVFLAKKQDSPEDYAFGMTVFKGLMTSETTIGVSDDQTSGGDLEAGGGFCTFTTTFALPDGVVANLVKALKAKQHSAPAGRLEHLFFDFTSEDPDPLVGIIPVLADTVTLEIPQFQQAGGNPKAPMFISAQGAGKGSIEAHGQNSFLVTCNELAAGAIAGSIKAGVSPFTVHCDLTEQMYIPKCTITVTAHFDKVYDQVSSALSVSGFFVTNASLEFAYSKLITSGAITTKITMDGAEITDELKQWIEKNVDDMRKTTFDLIKNDIFDWKPAEQTPASASAPHRGLFGSLFGGSSVSLKVNHQERTDDVSQVLELDTTIAVHNIVSGELDDLLPAVQADPDKYLAIVEVDQFFKKLQVAATSAINFGEKLSDGTDLRDPIESVQLEVGYPDFSDPGENGKSPNLVTRAQGFHYVVGNKDPNAGSELAIWTKDNAADIVNISFLRLDDPPEGWPADQVKLRKTIVFDGFDPRVELAHGGSTVVIETIGEVHAPMLTADEVGYVFVRFMLDRQLPPNVTLTLTPTIGARTDTLTITQANQKNALWEIFSDKYADEISFAYLLEVEVTGPNFTDDPVIYATPQPILVPLPTGRVKYVNPFKVALPAPPRDKVATINAYIKSAMTPVTAVQP